MACTLTQTNSSLRHLLEPNQKSKFPRRVNKTPDGYGSTSSERLPDGSDTQSDEELSPSEQAPEQHSYHVQRHAFKMRSAKLKRSHTFGGCATCRRRHVKCDQKTPTCERCRRAGLSCSFAPTLRWLVSTGLDICEEDRLAEDDATAPRTKQHLYTGKCRISTSSEPVAVNQPLIHRFRNC